MTLEEIYYIGQTIAVVAILGSLGAIWVQLRKDHALARADAQRELLADLNTIYNYLANNPDAVDAIRACIQDFDGAPYQAQVKFGYWVHRCVNLAQQAHHLREDELIDQEIYESALRVAVGYINTPGGRQHWQTIRLIYDSKIRAVLDEAQSSIQDGPKIWDVYPFWAPDAKALPAADAVNDAEPGSEK